MQNDMVVVAPTVGSREELAKSFLEGPLTLDPIESWFVLLFVTNANPIVSPPGTGLLSGKTVGLQKWYNPVMQCTSLVLVLDSPDILHRSNAYRAMNSPHPEMSNYVPCMTILNAMPGTLTRTVNSFVASLSSYFAEYPQTLLFDNEFILDSNGNVPNAEGHRFYRYGG